MYITEKEAQQLTGYGRTTLYNLRVSGAIDWTSAKSGRKVKYLKSDLEKLIGIKK